MVLGSDPNSGVAYFQHCRIIQVPGGHGNRTAGGRVIQSVADKVSQQRLNALDICASTRVFIVWLKLNLHFAIGSQRFKLADAQLDFFVEVYGLDVPDVICLLYTSDAADE